MEKVNSKPQAAALKVIRKIFLCLQINLSCYKKTLSINEIKSMHIYNFLRKRPIQKNENKNKIIPKNSIVIVLFSFCPVSTTANESSAAVHLESLPHFLSPYFFKFHRMWP